MNITESLLAQDAENEISIYRYADTETPKRYVTVHVTRETVIMESVLIYGKNWFSMHTYVSRNDKSVRHVLWQLFRDSGKLLKESRQYGFPTVVDGMVDSSHAFGEMFSECRADSEMWSVLTSENQAFLRNVAVMAGIRAR